MDLLVAFQQVNDLLGQLMVQRLQMIDVILKDFDLLLLSHSRPASRFPVGEHPFLLSVIKESLCFIRIVVVTVG